MDFMGAGIQFEVHWVFTGASGSHSDVQSSLCYRTFCQRSLGLSFIACLLQFRASALGFHWWFYVAMCIRAHWVFAGAL